MDRREEVSWTSTSPAIDRITLRTAPRLMVFSLPSSTNRTHGLRFRIGAVASLYRRTRDRCARSLIVCGETLLNLCGGMCGGLRGLLRLQQQILKVVAEIDGWRRWRHLGLVDAPVRSQRERDVRVGAQFAIAPPGHERVVLPVFEIADECRCVREAHDQPAASLFNDDVSIPVVSVRPRVL